MSKVITLSDFVVKSKDGKKTTLAETTKTNNDDSKANEIPQPPTFDDSVPETLRLYYLIRSNLEKIDAKVYARIEVYSDRTVIILRECASKTIFIDVNNPTLVGLEILRNINKILTDDALLAKYKKYVECGASFMKCLMEGESYIYKYYNPITNGKKSFWSRHKRQIGGALGLVSSIIIGVVNLWMA